jgi:hypothetical protein
LVGAAMLGEALIPFIAPSEWLQSNWGQSVTVGIAIVGLLALIIQACLQSKEDRLRDAAAKENRDILRRVEQRLGAGPTASTNPMTADLQASDPRVYVEVEEDYSDGFYPKTVFVLQNNGGEVAHRIQVDSLRLLKGNATFERIEAIGKDKEKRILPEIDKETGGVIAISHRNDLPYLLVREWDAAGEITAEFVRPMRIGYEDFKGTAFETTFDLVFLPMRYIHQRNAKTKGDTRPEATLRITGLQTRKIQTKPTS